MRVGRTVGGVVVGGSCAVVLTIFCSNEGCDGEIGSCIEMLVVKRHCGVFERNNEKSSK